ncbi:hypothetical protein B0H10DRAFT_2210273 [Mycena sp. CBHHK59/15]|nr:hypothetical protein B0H10DRAFT_2210273 [Mycena sp. CBHHK59/15]
MISQRSADPAGAVTRSRREVARPPTPLSQRRLRPHDSAPAPTFANVEPVISPSHTTSDSSLTVSPPSSPARSRHPELPPQSQSQSPVIPTRRSPRTPALRPDFEDRGMGARQTSTLSRGLQRKHAALHRRSLNVVCQCVPHDSADAPSLPNVEPVISPSHIASDRSITSPLSSRLTASSIPIPVVRHPNWTQPAHPGAATRFRRPWSGDTHDVDSEPRPATQARRSAPRTMAHAAALDVGGPRGAERSACSPTPNSAGWPERSAPRLHIAGEPPRTRGRRLEVCARSPSSKPRRSAPWRTASGATSAQVDSAHGRQLRASR